MKTMINQVHVEGLLYQHDLQLKVSGPNAKNPGTPYITGTIEIATDDEILNIVPIHYSYVTEVTSKGKANSSFTALKNIIDGVTPTIMKDGKEKAVTVRIDSAIGLNEFYINRTGSDELVSVKRNEGGFIHVGNVLDPDEKRRNTFTVDMVITGCTRKEANEEKDIPEQVVVKGAIFDFRRSLLPVEFVATNPHAMDYFEGLEASGRQPVFTKVWGREISEVSRRQIVEESAFGEPSIRTVTSTRKEFLITGAQRETYEWDSETTITANELTEALAARETYLATLKQRAATPPVAAAAATPIVGAFNF